MIVVGGKKKGGGWHASLSLHTNPFFSSYLGQLRVRRQLGQHFGRDHGRVDGGRGEFALQRVNDSFRNFHAHIFLRLNCGRAQVGRAHDVGAAGERVVGGRGFLFKHVERGAGHDARVERAHERGVVDDAAAGDVDDAGALFHLGKHGVVEQAFGFGGHRHVQRKEVGRRQGFVKRHQAHAQGGGFGFGRVGVVRDDVEPEALAAAADFGADFTETDDGERFAHHRHAHKLGPLPFARFHGGVGLGHVAGEGRDEGDAVLGRRDRVGGRRIHNEAPRRRRGRQIDVVHAHAGPAHDFEAAAGRGKHVGRDLGRGANDERVARFDFFGQLVRGQAQGDVDGAEFFQQLEAWSVVVGGGGGGIVGVGQRKKCVEPRATAHPPKKRPPLPRFRP